MVGGADAVNAFGPAAGFAGVSGVTPLFAAVHNGHSAIARLLVDARGDPNWQSMNGTTPVHLAAASGSVELVDAVTAAPGVWLDARDFDRDTPLHHVVWTNSLGGAAAARALVLAGASVDLANDFGETALDAAVSRGRDAVASAIRTALEDRSMAAEEMDAVATSPGVAALASAGSHGGEDAGDKGSLEARMAGLEAAVADRDAEVAALRAQVDALRAVVAHLVSASQ